MTSPVNPSNATGRGPSSITAGVKRLPELPVDLGDRLSRALGHCVVQHWGRLPQDVQQELFEAVVAQEGEGMRQQLALYLHGKHFRTIASLHARAITEPDSLGG
jgi:hypothetical protein